MYRLHIEQPAAARQTFTTRASLLLIGRAPDCQLRLVENGVADRHAAIERSADGYYIRDLRTATGIRLNDQPATVQRLTTGDTIEIGAVRMKFEILHQPPPERRAPDPLQIVAAAIIIVLLAGQAVLFFHIFSVHRHRKMPMAAGPEPAGISLQQPAQSDTNQLVVPPGITSAAAAVPAAPAPLGRWLRIQKIARTDAANEVTLRVDIRAGMPEREMDAAAASVTIQFYRQEGNAVMPSEVLSFRVPAWENFTTKTFAARFHGPPARLAGFVVRTYYRNQLQDEKVEPPAVPAAGNTTTR
jgi:hypothetical protein